MTAPTDVAVIGGGAAGLSAALTLAQAFRRVVVLDDATQANAHVAAVRGHLALDDTSPRQYLDRGRDDVERAGARVVAASASALRRHDDGGPDLVVSAADGRAWSCRRVVLATGVRWLLPAVAGLGELWGSLVQHCPYCHRWGDRRAASVVVIGTDSSALRLAGLLTQWSDDVVLLTGPGVATPVLPRVRAVPGRAVTVRRAGAATVEVVLDTGDTVLADACFLDPPTIPRLDLLDELWPERGTARPQLDPTGRSPVAGVWITGTAAVPTQKVVMAAAHGAVAGQAINAGLVEEDLGLTPARRTRPAIHDSSGSRS